MDHPAKLLDQIKAGSDSHAEGPKLLDAIPQNAGPRHATFRGGAVHCIRSPNSETFVADGHFVAVGPAPCPGVSAGYGGSRPTIFDVAVGGVDISPAHVESRWSWSSTLEYMHIGFEPGKLLELAEQELNQGYIDLQPVPLGTVDQKALALAQMLKAELSDRAAPNELYVDSLITVFGVHLLRTYGGARKAPQPVRGGLAPHIANRMRDFLNANFARKLSVADLAEECGLSPGHFIGLLRRRLGSRRTNTFFNCACPRRSGCCSRPMCPS